MSILRRMLDSGESRGHLADPPEWLLDALGGSKTKAGVIINSHTALSLDAVWACVTLLARSIGQMPLLIYRGQGRDRVRAKDSWQWDLLHESPNPSFAPDMFVEDTIGLLNLWGNFYAEKVRGRDRRSGERVVKELWRITPSRVDVQIDERDGKSKLFFIDGQATPYRSDRILHIPGFGYDGRKGLSPIGIHRQGLGALGARDEWTAQWYANSANPSGLLESPKPLTQQAAERLAASWANRHTGLRNFGKPAVLEDGVTWKQMGMPMVEQQFIEQMRFGVNQVARMFQVPPEKIGGDRSSSMTYSNVQSANLDFVIFSLQHWMVRVEQALKHDPDLFPPGSDLYPEFLAEGLLRGDPKARGEFYEILSRMRAITVNEIRERENMSPVPWGDEPPQPPGAPASGDNEEEPEPSQNGRVEVPV